MVTVRIEGGMEYQVRWVSGMIALDALEEAYNKQYFSGPFTYSIQYYGRSVGYLVNMLNETYDSFASKHEPYYFWEFMVNNEAAPSGIDNTLIEDGDVLSFSYVTYTAKIHAQTTLQSKYKMKKMLVV